MWGARGSFPPAAAMVVMVAVGSWSLGHISTVGIVPVFYGIIYYLGINLYASIKSIHHVQTGWIDFILFVNILHLFSVYSGINCEIKFYTNFGSHPVGLMIFPYIVALVHKNLLHVECTRDSCNISLIYAEVR